MRTVCPTFRWIAAVLSAVMMFGPLAPHLAHACAEMGTSAMPAHVMATSHDAMAAAPSESPELHHKTNDGAATHVSEASVAVEIEPSTSHDCMGPCAGSDCCSMRAAPLPQSDVVLADRVQHVTPSTFTHATRGATLYPRADRAPPSPPQPDLFSRLLSARLHVWTATYLT